MRHQDFSSLHRSTVGFERLFKLLDGVAAGIEGNQPSYPPYNIEQRGDNAYRITMAVAGFSKEDLAIDVKEMTLSVRGEKKTEDNDTKYLYRGIAERSFERRFQLSDHVEVTRADLVNGLLHIDLVRNLPERMQPKTISIGTASLSHDKLTDAS